MSLSNMDKNTITNLFNMINNNNNNNINYFIKNDYSTYSQLLLISKQIDFLKKQAIEILENHNLSNEINNIECKFKKVPGTYYYLYEINNKKILSLISNSEWNIYDTFLGKFYYDYDFKFYYIN